MYTRDQVVEASRLYFRGDTLAADAFTDKYALRDGDVFHEKTPDDMHDRLAREFHRIECNYANPRPLEQIRAALDGFRELVPQGSPMFGIGNPYAIVSLSNCTVLPEPEDSLSGILNTVRDASNLWKRRAGVGVSLGSLRPAGAPVRNAAKTSTGAASFASLVSFVCNKVAQNGRRGATMLSMPVSHPDIELFATCKHDQTQVTGANISVMLDDTFMNAVQEDRPWDLVFQGRVYRTVQARDVWHTICDSATRTADPGLLFIDNYRRELPLDYYPEFLSVTTNPCAELLLSARDSCRLLSVNLKGFVRDPHRKTAWFDFDAFRESTRLGQRLMDDLVDLEIECLDKITRSADTEDEIALFTAMKHAAERGRRTGLGSHALADMFACLGMRYDDPGEPRAHLEETYRTFRDAAYAESIQMATERGAFPAWDAETEKDCPFLQRLPQSLVVPMKEVGRRNGALLTQAPTGTVSLMSQTSSGLEPVFGNFYFRSKKVSDDGPYDRVDKNGEKWKEYRVYHHNVEEYRTLHGLTDEDPLPSYFVTAPEIDWKERVAVQSTLGAYIDHGLSSTLNCPKGTTTETVKEIYLESWKAGLKGITVYVDGSKDAVLKTTSQVQEDYYHRPETLRCEIHRVKVREDKTHVPYVVVVGLRDGKPFEVFAGQDTGVIPSGFEAGALRKYKVGKKSRYELSIDGDGVIKDLGGVIGDSQFATLTRLVSLALRNQSGVGHLVDQLLKETDSDLFAYSKVLARTLKGYIDEGAHSGARCPTCDGKDLVFQEGCFVCQACGYSGCG